MNRTKYVYYDYRGLEVTILHPLYTHEDNEAIFLNKSYVILNKQRPLEEINQDIQNDLSLYTNQKLCLSHVREYSWNKKIQQILSKHEVQRSPLNTLILEPTNETTLAVIGGSNLLGKGRPASTIACDKITTQETVKSLLSLIVLSGLIIIWLYRQILVCQGVVFTYINYHQT